MARIRTLTTVLFLIIIPSLFIYFLYYDSISSTTINNQYQPSTSSSNSQSEFIDSSSLPQQQQQQPPNTDNDNQLQHKYAAVWKHITNVYNHPLPPSLSSIQNDTASTLSSLRSSILGNHHNRNREFTYVQIQPPSLPTSEESMDSDPKIEQRRQFIKKMMKESWDNYVKYAWGFNELQPQTRNGKLDSIFGPTKLGATIVDSMDTLFLMDMKQEFEQGRQWIAQELDFKSTQSEISVFETIIRYVGGLLSCFALTGDPMFLYKSREIAQILLPAYNTATGMCFVFLLFIFSN